MEFTNFNEIHCFPADFMIFAKRLPLCQHAKIAMIPMVFHRVWGQLLRKILKKHPEMHFTGFLVKSQEFTHFSEI